MAKGAVGLVAGFWPDDVFRYLACPNAALDDALAARQARRRARATALIADRTLTYGELHREADAVGAALLRRGTAAEPVRLAVAVADPLEAVALVLGAARARVQVTLLAPTPAAGEGLPPLLDACSASLAVADTPAAAAALGAARPGLPVVAPEELRAGPAEVPRRWPPARGAAPAVSLADVAGDGLAIHSQASLVAAAVSWSAFLRVGEGDVLATDRPPWTWEGLMWTGAALFRGATAVLAAPGEPPRLPETGGAAETGGSAEAGGAAQAGGTTLRLTGPESLPAGPGGPAGEPGAWLTGGTGPVLVSVEGHLPAPARRRAERALGRAVVPLLGLPGTGPFLAGHPTWSPPDADGIPLTNVDLWPLNPTDGQPLQVPWEAVEYGEIGVRSPLTAVSYGSAERDALRVRDGWHRTGLVASMDPNGLFFLRGRVARRDS